MCSQRKSSSQDLDDEKPKCEEWPSKKIFFDTLRILAGYYHFAFEEEFACFLSVFLPVSLSFFLHPCLCLCLQNYEIFTKERQNQTLGSIPHSTWTMWTLFPCFCRSGETYINFGVKYPLSVCCRTTRSSRTSGCTCPAPPSRCRPSRWWSTRRRRRSATPTTPSPAPASSTSSSPVSEKFGSGWFLLVISTKKGNPKRLTPCLAQFVLVFQEKQVRVLCRLVRLKRSISLSLSVRRTRTIRTKQEGGGSRFACRFASKFSGCAKDLLIRFKTPHNSTWMARNQHFWVVRVRLYVFLFRSVSRVGVRVPDPVRAGVVLPVQRGRHGDHVRGTHRQRRQQAPLQDVIRQTWDRYAPSHAQYLTKLWLNFDHRKYWWMGTVRVLLLVFYGKYM